MASADLLGPDLLDDPELIPVDGPGLYQGQGYTPTATQTQSQSSIPAGQAFADDPDFVVESSAAPHAPIQVDPENLYGGTVQAHVDITSLMDGGAPDLSRFKTLGETEGEDALKRQIWRYSGGSTGKKTSVERDPNAEKTRALSRIVGGYWRDSLGRRTKVKDPVVRLAAAIDYARALNGAGVDLRNKYVPGPSRVMEYLPVFRQGITWGTSFRRWKAGKRLKAGTATTDDYMFLATMVVDQENRQEQGWIRSVAEGAASTLDFAAQLALTGGVGKAGEALATGAKALKGAETAGEALTAARGIATAGLKGGATWLKHPATYSFTGEQITREAAGQQAMSVTRGEEGALGKQYKLVDDSESLLTAIPKGVLRSYVELTTEQYGEGLVAGTGWIAKYLAGKVPAKAMPKAAKLLVENLYRAAGRVAAKARPTGDAAESLGALAKGIASRVRWDGILGEYSEEVLGDAVNGLLQLQPDYGMPGKLASGDVKGFLYDSSVTMGSLAAFPAGSLAARMGASAVEKSAAKKGSADRAKMAKEGVPDEWADVLSKVPKRGLPKAVERRKEVGRIVMSSDFVTKILLKDKPATRKRIATFLDAVKDKDGPSRKDMEILGIPGTLLTVDQRQAFAQRVRVMFGVHEGVKEGDWDGVVDAIGRMGAHGEGARLLAKVQDEGFAKAIEQFKDLAAITGLATIFTPEQQQALEQHLGWAAAAPSTTGEPESAKQDEKTGELHGNVQQQGGAKEGEGRVPAPQGGEGVRGGRQGEGPPEAPKEIVPASQVVPPPPLDAELDKLTPEEVTDIWGETFPDKQKKFAPGKPTMIRQIVEKRAQTATEAQPPPAEAPAAPPVETVPPEHPREGQRNAPEGPPAAETTQKPTETPKPSEAQQGPAEAPSEAAQEGTAEPQFPKVAIGISEEEKKWRREHPRKLDPKALPEHLQKPLSAIPQRIRDEADISTVVHGKAPYYDRRTRTLHVHGEKATGDAERENTVEFQNEVIAAWADQHLSDKEYSRWREATGRPFKKGGPGGVGGGMSDVDTFAQSVISWLEGSPWGKTQALFEEMFGAKEAAATKPKKGAKKAPPPPTAPSATTTWTNPKLERAPASKESRAKWTKLAEKGRERVSQLGQEIEKARAAKNALRRNATRKRAEAQAEIAALQIERDQIEKGGAPWKRRLKLAAIEDKIENASSEAQWLSLMIDRGRMLTDTQSGISPVQQHNEMAASNRYVDQLTSLLRKQVKATTSDLNKDEIDGVVERTIGDSSLSRPSADLQGAVDHQIQMTKEARLPRAKEQLGGLPNLTDEQRQDFLKKATKAAEGGADWFDKQNAIVKEAKALNKSRAAIVAKEAAEAAKEANAAAELLAAEEAKGKREFRKERDKETRVWRQLTDRARKLKTKKTKEKVTHPDWIESLAREKLDDAWMIREEPREDASPEGKKGGYSLVHIPTGAVAQTGTSIIALKKLYVMFKDAGLQWEGLTDVGKIPSEDVTLARRLSRAWAKDRLAELTGDRAEAIKKMWLQAAAKSAGDADMILDGGEILDHAKRLSTVRSLVNEVPEFAFDPVFVVKNKKLVFRDGYEYIFEPQFFGIEPGEIEEGQTVRVDLEDIGLKTKNAKQVVASALKRQGWEVRSNKAGFSLARSEPVAVTEAREAEREKGNVVQRAPAKKAKVRITGSERRWTATPAKGAADTAAVQEVQDILDRIRWARPEAIPTTGKRISRESLMEVFDYTVEEAEATMAIAKASGLDLSKIGVAKGEELPEEFRKKAEDVLAQIKEAADRMHAQRRSYRDKASFAKAWNKALVSVGRRFRGFTKKGKLSTAGIAKAVNEAVGEIKTLLDANTAYREYYRGQVAVEREAAQELYPELADDGLWAFYRLVHAIGSNQTQLDETVREAGDAWELFRRTGRFPSDADLRRLLHGGSQNVKVKHYATLNTLLDQHETPEAVIEWLMGTVSAEDARDLPKLFGGGRRSGSLHKDVKDTVREATGQAEEIPRVFVFGPKVGAYAMNLWGNAEYTTGDIWENHFWRAMFSDVGVAMPVEPESHHNRTLFQAAARRMADELGLQPSELQAVRWYYMISSIRRAGYTKARTDETIAGYTRRYVAGRKTGANRITFGGRRSLAESLRNRQSGQSSRLRDILGDAIFIPPTEDPEGSPEAIGGKAALAQQNTGDIRAYVAFLEAGRSLIVAMDSPGPESAIHELAHIMRRMLLNPAQDSRMREDITDDEIQMLENWAGLDSSQEHVWNAGQEEKFARGFERYLYEGKAPSAKLSAVFAKLKKWLTKVYKAIKASPIDVPITPQIRALFDKLLTPGEVQEKPKKSRARSEDEAASVGEGSAMPPAPPAILGVEAKDITPAMAKTPAGKKLIARMRKDSQRGRRFSVSNRSIFEFLAKLIHAKLIVSRSQTSRHPALYRPVHHVWFTRSGVTPSWNTHEAGHGLLSLLIDQKPLSDDLTEMLTQFSADMQGPAGFASAVNPTEGAAEVLRLWITDPARLPNDLKDAFEAIVQDRAPEVLDGLKDARMAYVYQRSRMVLEQLQSSVHDVAPKEHASLKEAARASFFAGAGHLVGPSAAWSYINRGIWRSTTKAPEIVGRHALKLAQDITRDITESLKNTPADVQSAQQITYHMQDVASQAIYGTDEKIKGIRVHNFREPTMQKGVMLPIFAAEDEEAMKAAGFDLPEPVGFGEFMVLHDESLEDVKRDLKKQWDAFLAYGQYKTALFRKKRSGEEYPNIELFPPKILGPEIKKLEDQHKDWLKHYKRVQRLQDQALILDALSGERSVDEIIRIKTANEDYWTLPRQVENRPQPAGISGGGVRPSSGIRSSYGSRLPFIYGEDAIEQKLRRAIGAYYDIAAKRSLLRMQQRLRDHKKWKSLPFSARAYVNALMVKLKMDLKRAAMLTPEEQATMATDAINKYLAKEKGEPLADDEKIDGVDIDNYKPKPLFRATAPRMANVISFFEPSMPGVRQYYFVPDRIVFFMQTGKGAQLAEWLTFIQKIGTVLSEVTAPWKRNITNTLKFFLGNVPRDVTTAVAFSEEDARLLIPGFGHAIGLVEEIVGQDAAERMRGEMLSRALQGVHHEQHRGVVGSFKRTLSEGLVIQGYWDMPWTQKTARIPGQVSAAVAKTWEMLNWLAGGAYLPEKSETIGRAGPYRLARNRGRSPLYAQAISDRATVNFTQHSRTQLISEWLKAAGFANPVLQASWQFFDYATHPDPKVRAMFLGAKMGIIAATGIGAAALTVLGMYIRAGGDDDKLKKLIQEEKNRSDFSRLRYMQFGPFKIYSDYGPLGAIQSTAYVLTMDKLLGIEGDKSVMAKSIWQKVADVPSLMQPHAKTMMELYLNYSFFEQRPIVSDTLRRAHPDMPSLQTWPGTPQLYKDMGQWLHVNPEQLKYANRQLLSALSDEMVGMMSRIEMKEKWLGEEPADMPIIGRLMAREARGYWSKPVQELREIGKEYDALVERIKDQRYRGEDTSVLQEKIRQLQLARTMNALVADAAADASAESKRPRPDREFIRDRQRQMTDLSARFFDLVNGRTTDPMLRGKLTLSMLSALRNIGVPRKQPGETAFAFHGRQKAAGNRRERLFTAMDLVQEIAGSPEYNLTDQMLYDDFAGGAAATIARPLNTYSLAAEEKEAVDNAKATLGHLKLSTSVAVRLMRRKLYRAGWSSQRIADAEIRMRSRYRQYRPVRRGAEAGP